MLRRYAAVIDLTTAAPKLLRRGAGDASMWRGGVHVVDSP